MNAPTTLLSPPGAALAKHRLQSAAAAFTSRYPSREQELAPAPQGSGLKPVLGNYGFPCWGTS